MTNVLYGALLAAATVAGPTGARSPAPAAVWVWPLSPPVVVRRFEPPPTPDVAGHRGIDLAAVAGQPVEAAGAGVVSFAGHVAGAGVVVVRHGELRTTYEPVEPSVVVGQLVDAGDIIGRVTGGHLGCAVCLHFGLRRGEQYLDPLTLFAQGPVRLLPVEAQDFSPAAPAAHPAPSVRRAHLAVVPAVEAHGAAAFTVVVGGAVGGVVAIGRTKRRRSASP